MAVQNYIWLDGRFIKEQDAKIHILTHSVQYASGIFEGIRAFKAKNGTAIFRLKEHTTRLFNTAKIARMPITYTEKQINDAIIAIVKKNKLGDCYIRPYAYYPVVGIGLANPLKDKRVSVAIAAFPFGQYLEKTDGLNCKVSSYRKVSSNILSPLAKFSANYMGSLLASIDVRDGGYDEAILLSDSGHVAEGPAENIFMVKDGVLLTPPSSANILLGITRDSVMKIAKEVGLLVEERDIHRGELYTCDEAFFVGTAAEVGPIVTIDGRKVGNGKVGPITKMLSDIYMQVVRGEKEEFEGWLTYV